MQLSQNHTIEQGISEVLTHLYLPLSSHFLHLLHSPMNVYKTTGLIKVGFKNR
jgi:hypothetical protein